MSKSKVTESEDEVLGNLEFADTGHKIIFGIFDKYRNESMYYQEYFRWYRYSMIYSQYTPEGVCKFF